MTTATQPAVGTKIAPKTNGWLAQGGIVTQLFGVLEVIASLGINSIHEGIDIAAKRGDPVTTPEHAVVKGVGWDTHGGGNFVHLLLDNGSSVFLFHLQDTAVRMGQDVVPGALLGHVDSTGNSTGDHLHFEVHNPEGKPIDPWNTFNVIAASLTGVANPGNPGTGTTNTGSGTDFLTGFITGFWGGATHGGHDPRNPPADEPGLYKLIDGVTCPRNWWKVAFVGIGVTFILFGGFTYFMKEEKALAITIKQDASEAGEAAAIAA